MHPKQHRIERAKAICGVRSIDRALDFRSDSAQTRGHSERARSWDLNEQIDQARQWRCRPRAEATGLDVLAPQRGTCCGSKGLDDGRSVGEYLYRGIGVAIAIALMEAPARLAGGPLARVPFVISIVLTLGEPDSKAATPYAVIVGHLLSALADLCRYGGSVKGPQPLSPGSDWPPC